MLAPGPAEAGVLVVTADTIVPIHSRITTPSDDAAAPLYCLLQAFAADQRPKGWPMASSPAPRTAVLYLAFVATLPSMVGKTVAVTGCTSGTGLVLAQTCGDLGAHVVMLNRPSPRADSA
jgi:hypothetical protein